ncbi:DNA polymerase I [candidate division KSB1 bacterium]|nr:DNA polymerase I [candidate division KSB1 bacterium]
MLKKTLFLIDGSAIAYRSYFAFIKNPLTNSRGENTSAVFGFLRFLFMIFDNEKPDYLAVVFDPKGPTFRHKLYKEYKATRQKMPDDMRSQVPQIHEFLKALNIPMIEVDGFEADDVIGTLAKTAQKRGFESFMVTGDKDFMQLVDSGIKMYNPKRAGEEVEILDEAGVESKVGLPPEKIIDYLALMGDTSDNIPGVPGIGPKTAVDLVQEFGSVESVLENAEKVSRAKVSQNLQTYREDALLSKSLVIIDTAVPLDVELESFKCQEPDHEEVVKLIKEFEFTSLLERFSPQKKASEIEYKIVNSSEQLEEEVASLRKAKFFVIDLETTDRDPMRADIVGMALSSAPGRAFYIPVQVEKSKQEKSGTIKRKMFLKGEGELFASLNLTEFLKPVLEDSRIKKSGHNIKYDMLVLSRHGIEMDGVYFDTMVGSFLLYPNLRQHNLDALALEHLDFVKIPISDLIGKGKKQVSIAEVPVKDIAKYACEDADITFRLHQIFEPKLSRGDLLQLFQDVEIPLIYVLKDVEQTGVSLDLDFLGEMSQTMQNKLAELVETIYKEAGGEFNINSTQQLGHILFEKLQLPKKKRTKTGYSTDVRVLEELAKIHELPRILIEYRELTKLKSTYVDALPSLVNPDTGRLHTSYNQTIAATGRLSSSDPNLQNIPIRTELGREIRRAFIPGDSDHVILDADYSQVELRVMAHLSKDPVLLEAFNNNEDIHTKTASLIFQVPPEELTREHRRKAKEINFGIMYGMGVFGLATRLAISNEEARDFITSYFTLYAKVKEFIDSMHVQVEEKGFVTTLLNRTRYLPEIRSKNHNIREFAKRTAVNTPIQGTAAELIKVAMINIWKKLKAKNYKTKMIMQVHDELVFEAPKSEVEEVKVLVKQEMENALKLDVPIKADVGVGPNWLEAK